MLSVSYQLGISFVVIVSSINVGWIMENQRIAIWLEWLKLLVSAVFLFNADFGAYASVACIPILVSLILLVQLYYQRKTQLIDNSELNTFKN
jgi:hypothetical protein